MIETLTTEGLPVAEALSSVGMREAEYDRWRLEYNGLRRTLGSLLSVAPKPVKRTGRAAPAECARRLCNSLVNGGGCLWIVDRPRSVRWYARGRFALSRNARARRPGEKGGP
jgi:hypothetical protein